MARPNTKLSPSALRKLILSTALATATLAPGLATANPWSDFTDEHGSISIDTSVADHTLIDQHTNLYIGRSGNLDIEAAQSVTIDQNSTSAMFVGKSVNGVDPTRILGTLRTTSNGGTGGSVMILDPNGVFFGKDSVIDTGGIIASTGELNNQKLINDNIVELSNFGDGAIVMDGEMTIAEGGLAAFVAPTVINNGIITAKAGRVELGASSTTTTVDLYGDGLMEIALDADKAEKLAAINNGTIDAEGGVIHMTAGAAKNIVDSMVNMNGVATASSVTQKGGKIVLGGPNTGTVQVAGTVAAKGTNGGSVTVKAQTIETTETASFDASATDKGNGGDIVAFAEGDAFYNGTFTAKGGAISGDGGFIETSAANEVTFGGDLVVNASAVNGAKGLWLIDPVDLNIDGVQAGVYVTALNGGTDVIADATNDVTVNADINWSGSGAFTIDAGNNVYLRRSIVSSYAGGTGVEGSVTILAGREIVGANLPQNRRIQTASGNVTLDAGNDIRLGGHNAANFRIETIDGDIVMNAGDDIRLTNSSSHAGNWSRYTTQTGTITLNAGDEIEIAAGDKGNSFVRLAATGMTMNAGDLIITDGAPSDSKVAVQTPSLTITRSSRGSIGLGDRAGDMQISQAELNALDVDTLVIGRDVATANRVSDMYVGNLDASAIASVSLNSLDVLNDGGSDIRLYGANSFDDVAMRARDDVTFWAGSNTTAANAFIGTTNDGTGTREINVRGTLATTGDLTLQSRDLVNVDEAVTAGGNLAVNTETAELNADLSAGGDLSGTASLVVVESNAAQIQDGVDIAKAGNATTVRIEAGTYSESVNVDKALILTGVGRNQTFITPGASRDGIVIDSDIGDFGRVYVRNLTVDGGRNGVNFTNAANANQLLIGGSAFTNNAFNGVRVGGGYTDVSLNDLTINYSDFINNGSANASDRGDGDIVAFYYNGNATFNHVDIQNDGAAAGIEGDYGIQLRGRADGTTWPPVNAAPMGTVTFNNISVKGDYRAALVGIQGYSATPSLTFNNVELGGMTDNGAMSEGWTSLYLSLIGSESIDLGNMAFLGGNLRYIDNLSQGGIDATGASFEGLTGATATLSENFAIEDKIVHALDSAPLGLVTWKTGNVFVTQNSGSIQRGVDASNTGGTVNVDTGTFNENLLIAKNGLTLNGAQTGVNAQGFPAPRTGGESVLAGYVKTEAGLDGLTIDGFTIENQGDNVPGFGGMASVALNNNTRNVSILNTMFDGQNIAGSRGIVTSIAGVENITVSRNNFHDLTTGVFVNPNAVNMLVDTNDFRRNTAGMGVDGVVTANRNRFFNNDEGIGIAGNATLTNNQFGTNGQNIALYSNAMGDIDLTTGNNKFLSSGQYKTTSEMTNDELFALEDTITHVLDNASLGRVVFKTGELFVTQNSGSIQRGIDASDTGGTLWVDDGTFNENLTVNKALTINGDGTVNTTILTGGGSGTGILVAADNVSLNGMIVENFTNGINVTGNIATLSMNDIYARNNNTGFKVADAASVDGLTVTDSRFNDNTFGWYLSKGDNNPGNTSTVTNVTVTDTAFDGNARKGLYAEKLDNASFTGVSVIGSGVDAGYNYNAGIDINLKNGTYDAITFEDLTVSGSGLNGTGTGNSVTIKARNDGATYSATPALLRNVTIRNADIDAGGDVGLAFGNNIRRAVLRGSDITGAEAVLFYGGVRGGMVRANTIESTGLSARGGAYGVAIDGNTGTITVRNNTVTGAGVGNGIAAGNGNRVNVRNNTVDGFENGVAVTGMNTAFITGNTVTNAGTYGIAVSGGNTAEVTGNTVRDGSGSGLFMAGTTGAVVTGNSFLRLGGDGVYSVNNDAADISGNTIEDVANGIVSQSDNNAALSGNTVLRASGNGLSVTNGFAGTVTGNTVEDAGQSAIVVDSSINSEVRDNILTGNAVGIETDGNDAFNTVVLTGNELTDNDLGMLFKGGLIDLTDLADPNLITGGVTGMRFLPDLGNADDLSLASNTIGATVFTGQTGNYIELGNGALFNPGTPTIIDALAADFDGVVPLRDGILPGILTATQRLAIESKIIDFDDLGTVGQILVGLTLDIAEEDLFALNLFSLQVPNPNVNVTFTGLPPVTLDAALLNALAPDAGDADPAALASIQPAAGGDETMTPEELASLETAAGGNQGCWATAGSENFATTVSFNFGGGIDSALNEDPACAQ